MRELIKGWLGEKMTTFGMRMRLDSEVYRRVHNVIIPAGNGTTRSITYLCRDLRNAQIKPRLLAIEDFR
jgi:hypothetical protein